MPTAGGDVGVSAHFAHKGGASRGTLVLSLRWDDAETLAQPPCARDVGAVSGDVGLET